MNIVISCNRKKSCKTWLKAEYDSEDTVNAISSALSSLGHKVVAVVDADETAGDFFSSCNGTVDLVFNIAEGTHGECRESQIPAMLEITGIPYTGPSVGTTAFCIDKHITKMILAANGISTAPWILYPQSAEKLATLRFPVVMKPVHEGSSIGISGETSVASDSSEANKKAKKLFEEFHQPILVEEFLTGAELTVGIFGNKKLEVLSILEIYTEMYPAECMGMATGNAKTVFESDSYSGAPRSLTDKQIAEVKDMAKKTYRILGCRDFGRVDIRLDGNGKPNVIEVNPIPGINPKVEEVSYFTKICRMSGMTYSQMISRILEETKERIQFH